MIQDNNWVLQIHKIPYTTISFTIAGDHQIWEDYGSTGLPLLDYNQPLLLDNYPYQLTIFNPWLMAILIFLLGFVAT